GSAVADTTTAQQDSSAQQQTAQDTTGNLSDLLSGKSADTAAAGKDSTAMALDQLRKARPLTSIIQFIEPTDRNQDGQPEFAGPLGYVAISDTAIVSQYLNIPGVKSKFPGDVKFLFGITE